MTHTRAALRKFMTPGNLFLAGMIFAMALDSWLSGELPFCRYWPH